MPPLLPSHPLLQRSFHLIERRLETSESPQHVRERRRALGAEPLERVAAAERVAAPLHRASARVRVGKMRQQTRSFDDDFEHVWRTRARKRRAERAKTRRDVGRPHLVSHAPPLHGDAELLVRAVVENQERAHDRVSRRRRRGRAGVVVETGERFRLGSKSDR